MEVVFAFREFLEELVGSGFAGAHFDDVIRILYKRKRFNPRCESSVQVYIAFVKKRINMP